MTEIRWEQYPLVARHELARNWLQRQVHLQLAPNTVDAYGRCLNDYLGFCVQHNVQPEALTREEEDPENVEDDILTTTKIKGVQQRHAAELLYQVVTSDTVGQS